MLHVCMYVCIFRAIQDGGARRLRFTRLAIIYVRISPYIYQTKLDIAMYLHGNFNKNPIERLSCEI